MLIPSFRKVAITASLAVCLIACNNADKKDKKVGDADTATSNTPPATPAIVPTATEVSATAPKKCFENMGLKYSSSVNITYLTDSTVTGSFSSINLETSKEEKTDFEGSIKKGVLTIKFKGTPPVVGDASEWKDKPWKIKLTSGKEKLLIPFNAKNYETSQWEDMQYEFTPCSE